MSMHPTVEKNNMATKKTAAKKTRKAGLQLPFTKANALALADSIYTDQDGRVSFLKLCDGTLRNGKDGGRTLHCAVGEAYFTFVNTDMRAVLRTPLDYTSDYPSLHEMGATAKVIEKLVSKAKLKSDTPANRDRLAAALQDAVVKNDQTFSGETSEYEERGRAVSEVFRKRVAPLLK
jgi:hypothetical protein